MELLLTVNKVFGEKYRNLDAAINDLIPSSVKEVVISGDLEKMLIANTMGNYAVLTVSSESTIGLIDKFRTDRLKKFDTKLLNLELKKIISILYEMTHSRVNKLDIYGERFEVSHDNAVNIYKSDVLNKIKSNRESLSRVFREELVGRTSTKTESISFYKQEMSASRDVIELLLLCCLTSEIRANREIPISRDDVDMVKAIGKRAHIKRFAEEDDAVKQVLSTIESEAELTVSSKTIQRVCDLCVELTR